MGDDEVRRNVEDIPAPQFPTETFTRPPDLSRATVAIVSTAGLDLGPPAAWELNDPRFTVIAGDASAATAAHVSPNFDRTGLLADPNLVLPADRLRELAARGVIGAAAPRHLSFMGAQLDEGLAAIRLDTGPAAAKIFKDDGVDVVLLIGVCPYCTRTISLLAHVLEAAGLSTIVLASVRGQAVKGRPPRALYCQFPFGRPLGRPNDPAFQHRVLAAAFALLNFPEGPVLADFPEVISDAAHAPMVCALPPRHDPNLHPAVEEARGLASAHRRGQLRRGGTNVGRAIDAEAVPAALETFARLAEGVAPEALGLDLEDIPRIGADIRWYYEETALALAEATPAARAAEAWIYERTEAGKVLMGAQAALRRAGHSREVWFYLAPADRARAAEGA